MDQQQLFDRLRASSLTCTGIRSLMAVLSEMKAGEMEAALEVAVTLKDSELISRLVLVAGYNEVKIDLGILCNCIPLSKEPSHCAKCFAVHGEEALVPLLGIANDGACTIKVRLFAVDMAIETSVRAGLELGLAKDALLSLEHQTKQDPQLAILFHVSSGILRLAEAGSKDLDLLWSRNIPLEIAVPDGSSLGNVAHAAPLRRPVAKLGRNQPCHCGSGKKYKKCCYAGDQELLRDASEYEGVTRSSLMENPGQVASPGVIHQMDLQDLERLAPSSFATQQLYAAAYRAQQAGKWSLSFDLLREWEGRITDETFDRHYYDELLYPVLSDGDLEIARKIREYCKEDSWINDQSIRLKFDLLENPQPYELLNAHCIPFIQEDDGFAQVQDGLFYILKDHFPALAIVIGRGVIVANEEGWDNHVILDGIRKARVRINPGMDPWDDPAESLLHWLDDRDQFKARQKAETEKARRLTQELCSARDALDQKRKEVYAKEQEIASFGKRFEGAAQSKTLADGRKEEQPTGLDAEVGETLLKLRRQVENLKAEIGEQQKQRRIMRKELNEEHKRVAMLLEKEEAAESSDDESAQKSPEPDGKILVPEYAAAFRKHCDSVPAHVARDALLAVGQFAAHDDHIWQKTRSLEQLQGYYRIRIGIEYRLMLKWYKGQSLEIMDIIPRQELESWIKRHR